MKRISKAGIYRGSVSAPASKSYLQRAIAIATLTSGTTKITGFSVCDDVKAACSIAVQLGADLTFLEDILIVRGTGFKNKELTINCAEAGLGARMFSPIAARSDQTIFVTGEGSLLQRPMNMVIEALQLLGKQVESKDGKLPLTIKGVMKGTELTIDGSESSQLLTGLLITLSQLENDSIIHAKNLKSIPYVNMTLECMAEFGLLVHKQDFHTFRIPGNQKVKAIDYHVEGDWSAASFHFVAAAIAGEVTVNNLNPHSLQADRAILDALGECGALVSVRKNNIRVEQNELKAFDFDASHCPDLFPSLAVLASVCHGISIIRGVHRLKNKECDRGKALVTEFSKVGIDIKVEGNLMFVRGGDIGTAMTDSHNDHRIAMAMAVLGLRSGEGIVIERSEAVSKSYPNFFNDFNELRKEAVEI